MTGIVARALPGDANRGANVVEGEWIAVPDVTIQYRALLGDTGETAGGHWCGRAQNGQGERMDYATHCAVLPPNPTAIFEPDFALREGHIQSVP